MANNSKNQSSSTRTYIIGFVISIGLTLEAYFLVVREALSVWPLIFLIMALAVIQLFIQLYFFLHLGEETKPRWKMTTFLFAGLVVLILVFGSLWIMTSLSYHNDKKLSPEQIENHIEEEEAIYR